MTYALVPQRDFDRPVGLLPNKSGLCECLLNITLMEVFLVLARSKALTYDVHHGLKLCLVGDLGARRMSVVKVHDVELSVGLVVRVTRI